MTMGADDLLFLIIVGGMVLTIAYLRDQYATQRRHRIAERGSELRLRELYRARPEAQFKSPPAAGIRSRNLSNGSNTQVVRGVADNAGMSPISNIFPNVNPPAAQNSGLGAIAAGNQKLTQDAQQIANPDSENLTGALVDLNQALVLTEAGANVISTENQMLGSLLDAFA